MTMGPDGLKRIFLFRHTQTGVEQDMDPGFWSFFLQGQIDSLLITLLLIPYLSVLSLILL
ncbi:MAG: hypothetical protein C0407_13565 [Desulfobacca sp.]|nr:hypothetical protein [Desulfobacca sp.]